MRNLFTSTALGGAAKALALTVTVAGLAACQTKLGQGGSMVSGSGGAAGASGDSANLKKCRRPVGTVALHTAERSQHAKAGLSNPVQVVRLIMQQSGCFQVVSRGSATDALEKERELAAAGELQSGSDMGKAQMKAADFIIEPAVIFQDSDAGGGGAAIGAILGSVGSAVAGAMQSKEAQTMLTMSNVRTGVQEAIAEGSAEKTDLAGGLGVLGGGFAGVGGAYESTDMGKLVTAAFLDAHNNLVGQLDAAKVVSQRDSVANWKTAAGVNMRSGANTDAPVLKTLSKGTRVRPIGDEDGDWWEVKAAGEQGWVHKDYIVEVN